MTKSKQIKPVKPAFKPAFDVISNLHKPGRAYKTLTNEGMKQKYFRLISRDLMTSYPIIFEELSNRAVARIDSDNRSKHTIIQDAGLDMIHQESPELAFAKKLQRKAVKVK